MAVTTTTAKPTGPHIMVYPFPTSGHIIPLLDLTQRLLTRGLRVTVVVTAANGHLLTPLLSSFGPPHLQHLVLPDCAPHNPAAFRNRLLSHQRSLQERHYPLLVDWFRANTEPPVAIVSDFFLGWTTYLAAEVGAKRIVFSPSGSFAYSVSSCTWQDLPRNDSGDMDFPVTFKKIPNSPTYAWWQISRHYRMGKEGDPEWELYRDYYLANGSSWGIIFNSFSELEQDYLTHVKQHFGNDKVWAVGPALPPVDDVAAPDNRGGSSSVPFDDVLTWLDSQKECSVVYICFGSRTSLTCQQMDVLAAVLEQSGVHFVWCVRQQSASRTSEDIGVLPEGFEDRVGGRGLVIKGWAPQVAILRHRAVAAFLTHCGWNSVLEGISAGVVMLTWPMGADQFTNAQLLVDQLGIGIRVGEESRKIPERGELGRMLSESVKGSLPERRKAKKLQEAAMRAINGGSSDEELNQLLKRLNELQAEKKNTVSTNGVV